MTCSRENMQGPHIVILVVRILYRETDHAFNQKNEFFLPQKNNTLRDMVLIYFVIHSSKMLVRCKISPAACPKKRRKPLSFSHSPRNPPTKNLEGGVQITAAQLVWSRRSGSEETGGIPEDFRGAQDIIQGDNLLLGPSQLAGETFVLCCKNQLIRGEFERRDNLGIKTYRRSK